MKSLVRWMNGTAGRSARAAVGIALIIGGIALGGPAGIALGAVGALALFVGSAGLCLLAPLGHLSLREGAR